MSKSTATAECPALPSGPVDFDALSAALAAGKHGLEALKEATKNNPQPREVQIQNSEQIKMTDKESEASPVKTAFAGKE